VRRFVGKLDELVFNGRAIARPNAFNLTAVEGGTSGPENTESAAGRSYPS
jgi:hypothetical protein